MFGFRKVSRYKTMSSRPQKFYRLVANFIVISNLCLLSFFAQASGNVNDQICSTQLGDSIPNCPTNKEQYASSFSHVPEIHTSCDSSDSACAEAQTYNTTTDYFTFYDIDANATIKYAITVTPTLRYKDDSILQQGFKNAQIVTPTDDDIAVTEGFNDVIRKKAMVDRMLTLTFNPDSSVTTADGNTDFIVDKIKDNCLTALDYISAFSSCAGNLNRSIDQGVNDNAQFYALINALEKLQTIRKIVSPKDLNLSDINKSTEFKVQIIFNDNSILVLDVEVTGTLVGLSLNMNASTTSDTRPFAVALNNGVYNSSTLHEANTIAHMPSIPILCKPVNLSETDYRVVKKVIIRLPIKSERVVYIYAKDTYFYTYQSC